MTWSTRERRKIEGFARPCLVLRFIDPEAQVLCVPPNEFLQRAAGFGDTAQRTVQLRR